MTGTTLQATGGVGDAGRPFLDTNVVLYAFISNDPRRERAEAVLSAGGVVSAQVLNEFASVARRKLGWEWPAVEAALALVEQRCRPVRALTLATHKTGLALARDHQLSFYDGLIVAAAVEAGCEQLLTEDLQNGRSFGDLSVVNPFLSTPQ
jgi:predicted nucleic acid-binding protein